MHTIRDLKNGQYQIQELGGKPFEGSIHFILTLAIVWKLDEEDLVKAILEMADRNHDWAEFGMMGNLILTGPKEERLI